MLSKWMASLLNVVVVAAVVLLGGGLARAAPPEHVKEPEPEEVGNQIIGDQIIDYLDDKTFWMGIVVLIFGLLVIVVQAWVIRSNDAKASLGAQMRYMIVLTVIVATLFTVVTGLSSQTVAPAMGLFGTIVGYLLGTGRERQKDPSSAAVANKGTKQDGDE